MADAHLRDGEPMPGGAGHNLAVEERAFTFHFDDVENLPFVEFEGAIHVPDFHPKEEVHQIGPAPGVQFAAEVLLPVDAETTDDVVLLHQGQQRREFVQIKLAVAVSVKNEGFGGLAETRLQGGAVTRLGGMMHHVHSRVGGGNGIGKWPRFVSAAVIHQDNFVIQAHLLKHGAGRIIDAADVVLLVVEREENTNGIRRRLLHVLSRRQNPD